VVLLKCAGSGINVVENGHLVSRRSDFIIYSVEAEYIDDVVRTFGPCNPTFPTAHGIHLFAATKVGAIVGGQTSCKAPEIAAFEKYLPEDVKILPIHSLHGPNVDPRGQPLVSFPVLTFSYR
jgi:prephenate dehydrogenase (NADP+)